MIVDGYAGPGGWSEGLRTLGLTDIGIEWDAAACATRAAAGHTTIRADVATFRLEPLAGRVDGLIMSPPCQAFSTAGKGEGRQAIDELRSAIAAGEWGWHHDDHRVRHVLEVGRWAETLRPTWIACEQVPPVLPLWVTYAERWRHRYGWSTWAGILNAADYGVPQTRRRAFLIARTDGRPVGPPAPTHARGGEVTLFGELAPWVSMADALGWSGELDRRQQNHGEPVRTVPTDEPAPTVTAIAGAKSQWVVRTGANSMVTGRTADDVQPYERSIDEPAPTLDSKVGGAWKLTERQANGASRAAAEPAMTISASADNGNYRWVHDRPATTIVGDGRAFGPHAGSAGEPQSSNTIRLTIRDALTLQGFPADYPVQGTKTKQFEQVGNAVPPPLAAAVIGAVTGTQVGERAA